MIGVVATDATLDKGQCQKLASIAHDGLARCVSPAHTPFDGDTLFALSIGTRPASLALLGALATDVTARAAVHAVEHAIGRPGCPAARDRAGLL